MKILIVGDSFAADWSVKYNDYHGWPNLLAQKFEVTNLAKAGVGQYKIYKQLQNIDDFDLVYGARIIQANKYSNPNINQSQ